ncbi:MAG: Mov34/MPN/PAD-1 family protein [Thermoplasmata archaeon]
MMALSVPEDLLASIGQFAQAAYPEECCGFLLSSAGGAADGTFRRIVGIAPAANRAIGRRGGRFVIPPDELREAERDASARAAVVSGIYHSHPDHPARPSMSDQENAWPWYAYLIVSSEPEGRPGPFGAFELDPERREFREVALVAEPVICGAGDSAPT